MSLPAHHVCARYVIVTRTRPYRRPLRLGLLFRSRAPVNRLFYLQLTLITRHVRVRVAEDVPDCWRVGQLSFANIRTVFSARLLKVQTNVRIL